MNRLCRENQVCDTAVVDVERSSAVELLPKFWVDEERSERLPAVLSEVMAKMARFP